jgi:hypothetical protein
MGAHIQTLADARRLAKANLASPSPADRGQRAGCRGADCPAFAVCQGRCTTRRAEPRIHPDGGVWIDSP